MPFIWWLSVWHTGYQRMRLRMTWIRRDKCSTMHDCFYGLLNWRVSHWGWTTYWSTLVSPEQNWQCHSVRVISWTWYQTGWFMGSTQLCLSLGKSCQLWLWVKMPVGCLWVLRLLHNKYTGYNWSIYCWDICVTVLSLLERERQVTRCCPTLLGILSARWPNTDLLLGWALLGSAYRRRSLLQSTPTLEGGQCTGAHLTKRLGG